MAQGDVDVEMTNIKGMKCAVFDGTDDRIEVSHSGDFIDLSNFTISCWVNIKDLAVVNGIFIKYLNWGSAQIMVKIDGSKIKFRINDTANNNTEITSGTNLTANVWQHIVVVRDDTHLYAYLDGASDAAPVADNTGVIVCTEAILFGSRVNVDYWLNGSIANMQYFNVALSAAEILQLYNKEKITRGLVSRWNFLDNSYNDSVGSNNGTNHGSYLTIMEETLAAAIKAQRATAGDRFMLSAAGNGKQVINTQIEEI